MAKGQYLIKTYKIILAIIIVLFSLSSCISPQKSSKPKKYSKTENSNKSYNNKIKKSSSLNDDFYKKTDIKLNGDEDVALISEISSWLNTPYKYGGNDKSGTDCSGFTMTVYKNVYKINLYRTSIDQLKNVTFIDKVELKSGDLLFFITSGKNVSHVGIYIANNKFIHSSSLKGVVINDLNEDYYKKTFFKAGRVKKNGN